MELLEPTNGAVHCVKRFKNMQTTIHQTWANGSSLARPSKSIHDLPFIQARIPMQIAVNDSDSLKLESLYKTWIMISYGEYQASWVEVFMFLTIYSAKSNNKVFNQWCWRWRYNFVTYLGQSAAPIYRLKYATIAHLQQYWTFSQPVLFKPQILHII